MAVELVVEVVELGYVQPGTAILGTAVGNTTVAEVAGGVCDAWWGPNVVIWLLGDRVVWYKASASSHGHEVGHETT